MSDMDIKGQGSRVKGVRGVFDYFYYQWHIDRYSLEMNCRSTIYDIDNIACALPSP